MHGPKTFGILSLAFALIFFIQGSLFSRDEITWLMLLWSALYLIWGWSGTHIQNWRQSYLWILALAMLTGLTFLPNLSDDYFRFIWDGQLLNAGENPYVQLPCFYEVNRLWPGELSREIYVGLNSPRYYTVYPPLNQMVFALGTWFFPGSVMGAVGVMKAILILSFLATIRVSLLLLHDLNMDEKRIFLLAFMPLLWIEWIGNLHFEGLMVFFLLLAILKLHNNKPHSSALFFGLAVSVKLIPLMFLPFLIRRLGWKGSAIYGAIVLAVFILPFLLFYHPHIWENYTDSLDLYFRNFEFNASLYYLIRSIGSWWYGYNPIHLTGPLNGLLVAVLIVWMSWKEKDLNTRSLILRMILAHSLYLFLSTTIHPWYLSLGLSLAIFTDLRYIYLWGISILLSYTAYSGPSVEENKWILIMEYLPVMFLFVSDLIRMKKTAGFRISHSGFPKS